MKLNEIIAGEHVALKTTDICDDWRGAVVNGCISDLSVWPGVRIFFDIIGDRM